jgi:hypothetical protein
VVEFHQSHHILLRRGPEGMPAEHRITGSQGVIAERFQKLLARGAIVYEGPVDIGFQGMRKRIPTRGKQLIAHLQQPPQHHIYGHCIPAAHQNKK